MNKDSRILIACEESQMVTTEFRELGFYNTFSCDLLPTSGLHPEWHLQQDVTELLKQKWDMIIAFPPCTYLTVTGNRWFNIERYGEQAIQRHKDREFAIKFFKMFAECDCEKVAIENPVGIMSSEWRKPDQIINPYEFGDAFEKKTCLWLKGLPKLEPTKIADFKKYRCKCGNIFDVDAGKYGCCPDYAAKPLWDNQTKSGQNKLPPSKDRAKLRSKTYPGIAAAMAMQWGGNACR